MPNEIQPVMSDLPALVAASRAGDPQAVAQLFRLLYDDLHRLARSRLRQHRTMTLLDTTALLHESFLKIVNRSALPTEDRAHFFAYAASVMRSVIVDFARARQAERRGGEAEHVRLDTAAAQQLPGPEDEVLRVHEALTLLAQADARLARIVEMRYFSGFSEGEIAQSLGLSERTVRRDWDKARLLLKAALE